MAVTMMSIVMVQQRRMMRVWMMHMRMHAVQHIMRTVHCRMMTVRVVHVPHQWGGVVVGGERGGGGGGGCGG